MKLRVRKILDWVDSRTGLETAVRNFLYEDIPASSGWHHVFGSVALFLFFVQVFTGILLAFNYAPQPGESYYSLQYILNEVKMGRLMRGLHHWGASVMVVIVALHALQVAIWGGYKKPREATWMVGVLLLLLVLGFGLTGYLLPWDNRSYWSTVVTIQIASLAPGVGSYVTRLLGSNDGTVGVATFARFYTLHTLILPALTGVLAAVHIYLVRKHGVAPAPSDAGRETKKFYPRQAFRDTIAMFAVFIVLFLMAATLDVPLGRLADPTDTSFVPRPEWYFLFLFETLKFFEGPLEVFGAVVLPTAAILLLASLPFLDRGKIRAVGERKGAWAVAALIIGGWAGLTASAVLSTPPSAIGSQEAVPFAAEWNQLTPVELAGLWYFRAEKCESCHNLGSGEPKLGPTLATVAEKKSADWMIAHFKNPQQVVPGTPMPALQLPASALNALASFLLKLTPENSASLEMTPDYAAEAARIYAENNCPLCHLVNGAGNTVGPPLNGLASRRDREWVVGHFREPTRFSPGSMMPPYDFEPKEMDALVNYLFALPPK